MQDFWSKQESALAATKSITKGEIVYVFRLHLALA